MIAVARFPIAPPGNGRFGSKAVIAETENKKAGQAGRPISYCLIVDVAAPLAQARGIRLLSQVHWTCSRACRAPQSHQ
jgi:hypothetical protein